MATKPDDLGKQQQVLEGLQKAGTLKKSTVVHVSPADQENAAAVTVRYKLHVIYVGHTRLY